jgi:hypothetical protein
VVTGGAVFGLQGQKLYDLKGSKIYKLNGDLVGHLSDARGAEKRLDKTTDKLFPAGWLATIASRAAFRAPCPASHRVACGAGRFALKIHPFRGCARTVEMERGRQLRWPEKQRRKSLSGSSADWIKH